jgi:hypothetical protein
LSIYWRASPEGGNSATEGTEGYGEKGRWWRQTRAPRPNFVAKLCHLFIPSLGTSRNRADDLGTSDTFGGDFLALHAFEHTGSGHIHAKRHSQWIWRSVWCSNFANFDQHGCRIAFEYLVGKPKFDWNWPKPVGGRSWPYPAASKRTRDWSATIIHSIVPNGTRLAKSTRA